MSCLFWDGGRVRTSPRLRLHSSSALIFSFIFAQTSAPLSVQGTGFCLTASSHTIRRSAYKEYWTACTVTTGKRGASIQSRPQRSYKDDKANIRCPHHLHLRNEQDFREQTQAETHCTTSTKSSTTSMSASPRSRAMYIIAFSMTTGTG